jgi:hypothetical protein
MQTVSAVPWLAMLLLGGATWMGAVSAMPTSSASASPSAPAAATAPASAQHVRATPPASIDVHGLGHSVDSRTLATFSGGTEISERMTLNGTVSDNSASHVVTGSNAISSDSFSGAAGLPMVIQNTGNNVLIQNATIVNVQFQP